MVQELVESKSISNKAQLKLVVSFSKSILIAMKPSLPCFLNMVWTNSWTIMALSTPFLLGTKAVCRGETSWFKTQWSRAIMSLVMILYIILQRPIGRLLLIDFRLLHLGMRVINVWLRYSGILMVLNICLISSLTEGPTTSQNHYYTYSLYFPLKKLTLVAHVILLENYYW